MKLLYSKHIIIVLLSVLIFTSCRSKKKTFNGTSTLECADYDDSPEGEELKQKKKTKWRIEVWKDETRVVGGKAKKGKRGKSKLFKHQN